MSRRTATACGFGFHLREALRIGGGIFELSTASNEAYLVGTRTRVLSAQDTGGDMLMLTSQCDVSTAIRDMTSNDVPQGLAEGLYAFSTRPHEIDFFTPGVTPTEPKRLVATYRLTSRMP